MTFLLLATTAGTLEAQLTPEQRAAREPAGGTPIWATPGPDLSTPLTDHEYYVRALIADRAQRTKPELRPLGVRVGPRAMTGVHWMTLTSAEATPGPVRPTGNRVYQLTAGKETMVTLSARRTTPGTTAIVALRIDDADGVRHWSATPTSIVDRSRRITLELPALPQGNYLLTIEVFDPDDPGIPESRSVNPLRVD